MIRNPAALSAFARGDMENFRVASTPGGIEAQEAAGQAALVANASLPKNMDAKTRAALESFGVKFGADVDDLFITATLPAGWKKQATEHSMHSDLLDEKGRKRAGIFYKAAFYDRNANIHLTRRYGLNGYFGCDENGQAMNERPTHYKTVVMDCDAVIHEIGAREKDEYKTGDEHEIQAEAWLNEHFPQWKEITAYW